MASVKFLVRQDGSRTAYEVIGNDTTGAEPIVFVGGLSLLRGDWEGLLPSLAKDRQGTYRITVYLY
jgi:pimeloyl-ACP methyl ester carboxylesterase